MAIVWNYQPTSGSAISVLFATLDGNQVNGSPSSFTLIEGPRKIVFQGSFTFDGFNHVNGGTITGLAVYQGATLLATATGYAINAFAFVNSVGSADAFVHLLGASMTLNGSILHDIPIYGGLQGDIIRGNGGSDEILGNDGDDFVSGGEGYDVLDGGLGSDTADYSEKSASLAVVLNGAASVSVRIAEFVEDEIEDFENVIGGKGNDELTGDARVNMLIGNAGDDRLLGMEDNDIVSGGAGRDRIDGGNGNDQLVGGDGRDILRGGADSDTFIFNTALGPNNVDRLKDFSHVADTMMLIDDIFVGLMPGALAKKAFYVGEKAHDGNDRIVYDKEDGRLFFDVDGKGGAKQVLFAKVEDDLRIKADDFLVA
jgi:Ca2+-binding RTX toxin-like protein